MKNLQAMGLAMMALALIAVVQTLPVQATADFSISINPTHGVLYAGIAKHVNVTVTSIDGFSGTVTFSAFTPSGYTTSFNPSSVNLSSGGSASSDLSITADPDCNVGPGKTITVRGTSGSLVHQKYFTIDYVVC